MAAPPDGIRRGKLAGCTRRGFAESTRGTSGIGANFTLVVGSSGFGSEGATGATGEIGAFAFGPSAVGFELLAKLGVWLEYPER